MPISDRSLFVVLAETHQKKRRMLGAWKWYQNQLSKNPVRTQVISSGVLWATGDVAAQYVSFSTKKRLHLSEDKQMKKFKIDWKRVATTSMFGLGFVGPIGHFWYEGLEHVAKHRLRLWPNSLQFVTAKLAADTLIFGPVHLLAFFTYMGLASGKKLDQIKEDVKRDFLPAFMMEGSTWTLVQTVNFRFVPVRYQLLYVNFFCLLDSTFLSWFEQQEDAPWKRWLKSLLSAKS